MKNDKQQKEWKRDKMFALYLLLLGIPVSMASNSLGEILSFYLKKVKDNTLFIQFSIFFISIYTFLFSLRKISPQLKNGFETEEEIKTSQILKELFFEEKDSRIILTLAITALLFFYFAEI